MTPFLIAAVLVLLGAVLLFWSRYARDRTGMPSGRLVYQDGRAAATLFSAHFRLSGRPDYLVRTPQGVVPVEVKSAAAAGHPRSGHILQLAAYCLLVEEEFGKRPPYGVIRYSNGDVRIDNDAALRSELLTALNEMRSCLRQGEAPAVRRPERVCRECGHAEECLESP